MRLNALTPAAGHKAAAAEDGTTEKAPPPGAYVLRTARSCGQHGPQRDQNKNKHAGATPLHPHLGKKEKTPKEKRFAQENVTAVTNR